MTAPIPAEAVKDAARAVWLFRNGGPLTWDDMPAYEQAEWLAEVQVALQAALPHLTAAIADEIETARRELPDIIPNTLHTAMRSADDCSWAMAQSRDIAYYFGRL